MEELQVFIQAQFNSSSSLLIREFNRTRGNSVVHKERCSERPSTVASVAASERRSVGELRRSELPELVSVHLDEEDENEQPEEEEEEEEEVEEDEEDVLGQVRESGVSHTTSMTLMRTINTDAIPVVEATSSQSQRNTARFTFVRGKAAKYQERATKAAMQRITESAVNLASRASRYNVQVEESNTWAPRVYAWVTSRRFMFAMMSIIFLNLILLGIEVEVSAYLPLREVPTFFFVANIIIVCIYTLEMSLKLIAFGVTGFFFGPERLWNIFDFAIITLALVETIGDVVATAASSYLEMDSSFFRILRFVRLGRALRGIRVIRLIHYVGALRTLVFAILSTAASLFWTLVLLVLVFYIFGIMFAQIVTDHCRHGDYMSVPKCHDNGLTTYWFGVIESMLTLFMVVSGGVNWEDIIRPLRPVSAFAVACLILYIVISVFTILNVVTGVFCNTAIESAHADRDIAIMKQLLKQKKQVASLREVFKEIDTDQTDSVNILDLKAAMEGRKLASFMESLGISTEDVWTLFMIIDQDESGEITLDEFVSGCMQLHGPAKSLQMAKMSYENKVTRQEIKRLNACVTVIMKYFDLELDCRGSSRSTKDLS
ncbi:Cation channel sperm-associated protein 1 (CatSper1) [Durusdinium trenchii]